MTFLDVTLADVRRCQDMEQLFELWRKAHLDGHGIKGKGKWMSKDSFIPDGMIYEGANHCKVLFVGKETDVYGAGKAVNNGNGTYTANPDYFALRDKAKKSFYDADNFTRRLAILKSVIDGIPLAEVDTVDFHDAAYIDINKRGGFTQPNTMAFDDYLRHYTAFVVQQIKLLKPEYIVCLGCYDKMLRYVLPFFLPQRLTARKCRLTVLNSSLAVQAHHPSYRSGGYWDLEKYRAHFERIFLEEKIDKRSKGLARN